MPVVENLPVGEEAVLVVGSGPSHRFIDWHHVRRHLAKKHGGRLPALALLNRNSIGKHAPDYAVVTQPSILVEFAEKGVFSNRREQEGIRRLVTLDPSRSLAREKDAKVFAPLLESEKTILGRPEWNVQAAGPLAVWTFSSMGFGSIYLFAFDGTADPSIGPRDRKRFEVWEHQLIRWRHVKQPLRGKAPSLYRIWPEDCPWGLRDPLRDHLSGTLTIANPPQKVRRKKMAVATAAAETPAQTADDGPEGPDGG